VFVHIGEDSVVITNQRGGRAPTLLGSSHGSSILMDFLEQSVVPPDTPEFFEFTWELSIFFDRQLTEIQDVKVNIIDVVYSDKVHEEIPGLLIVDADQDNQATDEFKDKLEGTMGSLYSKESVETYQERQAKEKEAESKKKEKSKEFEVVSEEESSSMDDLGKDSDEEITSRPKSERSKWGSGRRSRDSPKTKKNGQALSAPSSPFFARNVNDLGKLMKHVDNENARLDGEKEGYANQENARLDGEEILTSLSDAPKEPKVTSLANLKMIKFKQRSMSFDRRTRDKEPDIADNLTPRTRRRQEEQRQLGRKDSVDSIVIERTAPSKSTEPIKGGYSSTSRKVPRPTLRLSSGSMDTESLEGPASERTAKRFHVNKTGERTLTPRGGSGGERRQTASRIPEIKEQEALGEENRKRSGSQPKKGAPTECSNVPPFDLNYKQLL